MIDRALWMMLGLWTITFMFIGIQYLIADPFGLDITVNCTDGDVLDWACSDYDGKPIKSHLIGFIDTADISSKLADSLDGTNNGTIDRIVGFTFAAAYVAWNLIAILSGVTIFQLLWFLGVPFIIVTGVALVYYVLLARAILGYVRGV